MNTNISFSFFLKVNLAFIIDIILLLYFSEEFEKIRGDKEQLEAAKMLLKYPIVVISGKGGCGKTTVVTKVLSYEKRFVTFTEVSPSCLVYLKLKCN